MTTILVVDDDIRNIFAIDSLLEKRQMTVIHAENGRIGVAHLRDNPDVDLVLMDMMMPEMDGIEATQLIREDPRFTSLPIISLTAKAMKGDRDKAIQAGGEFLANDRGADQVGAFNGANVVAHRIEHAVGRDAGDRRNLIDTEAFDRMQNEGLARAGTDVAQ